MLEEALRNDKFNPGETALAMLSFLDAELSAGGPAAEARFLNLYGLLCERIFGAVMGADDGFRHKDGGWFSYAKSWPRPPSAVLQSPRSPMIAMGHARDLKSPLRRSESSSDSDPVVKLIGKSTFSVSLLEAMSNLSESRPSVGFAFPFHALSKQMQDTWLALVEESLGGSSIDSGGHLSLNDVRLLGSIFRKRPSEQNQLRHYKQHLAQKQEVSRQPVHLSPRGFTSAVPTRTSPRLATAVPPDQSETEPSVMLTVLEHYLLLFLRFPLFVPDKNVTVVNSIPGVNVHRITAPAVGQGTVSMAPESFGERLYQHIFRSVLNHFLPYEPDEKHSIALSTNCYESELFLRLLISMWLDSGASLLPTAKVVHAICERRRHAGLDPLILDLNASYDLVHLARPYEAPPAQVQKCLRFLIVHAVSDPLLHKYSSDPIVAKQNWRLSPCMTVLQYPFYNFVRTSFRYASVHSPDSAFYSALNLWLIWCEPWNLTRQVRKSENLPPENATRQGIGSVAGTDKAKLYVQKLQYPQGNEESKYAASWDMYIAANVYMYAVPLAIFLRRARELDFSAANYNRSIVLVKRVFRVFSPQLVDAVAFYLQSQQSPDVSPFLRSHVENLGSFAPPSETMTLQTLKADMQSLMEEIDLQHLKKVRELDILDWLVGQAEGVFGKGVVSGEEKGLEKLSERAKVIARLPIDYDLFSRKNKNAVSKDSPEFKQNHSIRSKDGTLTNFGRDQVLIGTINCMPEDIPYDPVHVRTRRHESAHLVKLTIWGSDALKKRLRAAFGSTFDESFSCINLRFLADKRVAAVLVTVLVLLLHCFFQYIMMHLNRLSAWLS